jgi:2-oxo-3-hexenedioate decarboxylase
MDFKELAERVDTAAKNASAISQLSSASSFSVDESYEIQRLAIDRRIDRGEKLIGLKMGFTSEAKMKQMGVHDMIWGRLTDAMMVDDKFNLSAHIHPRAEPEICFRVNRDINTELTIEECKQAVDAVAPAIEVIDSRYENFKFSLEDVIADNCSSAGIILGEWLSSNLPLGDLGMSLEIDGEVVEKGNSKAILGDPWKSMAAATRLAAQYNQPIAAGSIIMAGASTPAVFLKANQRVKLTVDTLGTAEFVVG